MEQLWSDPQVEPVADGVFRIPLPLPSDGLRAVNVYAIRDGDGLVLIDSGWAIQQARELLEKSLATLDADLGTINRFLVTHIHRDHYSQAVVLRREFGTRVGLGLGEQPQLELIRDGNTPQLSLIELGRCGAASLIEELLAAGGHPSPGDYWDDPDEWLTPETKIEFSGRSLRVLPTPGHTRGHVVFVDAGNGLLFSGDHVLPHITPSIGVEPQLDAQRALSRYLSSLELIVSLPDLRMLPAHGPTAASTHARVRELQHHHDVRLAASLAAVQAGARTAYEVATRLGWTRRERAFADLDLFNRLLATHETKAHLEVLVERGQLASGRDGDAVTYFVP